MWGLLAAPLMQGIFNMYGAHKQGKADASMYGFQARQDEENARAVALENAIAEDSLRKQNRKQLGELEARQAENGLSGSTFDRVLGSSAANLEQDALNLRYQGLTQWANYKNSAAMNRYGATMSRANARTNVWAQGLNTAVSMLGTYAMYGANKSLADKMQRKQDINNYYNSDLYKGASIHWGRK